MPDASYAIGSFLGGEISTLAQGRFDKPDYRTSMKRCRNSFPVEAGAHVRRPGTIDAGTTLNGKPGRVIQFDRKQSAPLTWEYTDGFVRARSGQFLGGATLATPYIGGSWANIRVVQAETTQILLNPAIPPQALVESAVDQTFSINPAIFNDGPYLDPFTNGVQAVPSAVSGLITLELQFPAYSATTAYAKGAFVTSSSTNYVSLQDQNVNNTPASSPSFWQATSAGAAINNGQGFLGTDVGRLVRLFSEPAAWLIGTTYSAGSTVSYNPSGIPGASTYWQALTSSNTGNAPGSDLTHWQIIPQGAALWSWGKITGLSNVIDRALSGSSSIGSMTGNGGLNAAFNGSFSQVGSASAALKNSGTNPAPNQPISVTGYVGKNYSSSTQKIMQATVWPSSDAGFAAADYVTFAGDNTIAVPTVTINLRAKASSPSSSSDGTLLGSVIANNSALGSVTIVSNDQITAWAYVWIEITASATTPGGVGILSYGIAVNVAQLSFFNPAGTGTTQGVTVEILGPPLLYTTPILTWRLGLFTAGSLATCGVYEGGRIWFGGAVDNRVDACYSNGNTDANGRPSGTINMAPTDQYGAVTAAHAISYTFNSRSVNPILWMRPDLQGIKVGTQAGEWLIQAPTAGPISPLNITARNVTNHGSSNIEPVDTEHTLVFVQRHQRRLLEYFPDVFSGKFSAPNLADKAAHFTRVGIAELAYTSAVTPIIWWRCTDGTWGGITYKRDSLASSQPPTFYGWHGHTLGSGRVVESICAGASVGGNLDALTMVTNDPVTNIRRVEILTDVQDEDTPLAQSWFLDGAVLPTLALSTTAATLSGLPWPDGTVVQVFCAGLDCGDPGEGKAFSDFTVLGGQISILFGDGISAGPGRGLFSSARASAASAAGQLIVGFVYTSDGQIVTPMTQAETGARNGPAFAKLKRGHRWGLKLVNTLGLSIGGDFTNLRPIRFTKGDKNTNIDPLTTFTGVVANPLDDDYDYENGTPAWRSSRVFPANVVIVGANLATQDQ